ncbi:hypothetical protein [Pseudoalteromonas maricaloris]|uniref:hypothetical protein n=1 Tax=Pseudoalteromonas maricaloris TaxID=184924 RepID=UPI0003196AC8|nr:hypothetical protein [Pseudoalteromonas flavipulchra]
MTIKDQDPSKKRQFAHQFTNWQAIRHSLAARQLMSAEQLSKLATQSYGDRS